LLVVPRAVRVARAFAAAAACCSDVNGEAGADALEARTGDDEAGTGAPEAGL
jgi:hypothetical protein